MRLLIVLFSLVALSAIGQYDMPSVGANRTGTFWSLDFSVGIPSNWQNTSDNAPALWEYRGVNTTPNAEVGGRGSCETSASGGLPIQSPSSENGFVIFDSNYWDNDANPCGTGNFGTGQAPGPHYAALMTSSFNFTLHPYPALEFYSSLRDYQCTARVEMSVSGGPWEIIYTDPYTNSGQSENGQLIQIPLTGAGGEPDVRFQFVFDGLYYFWMIDDIRLFDLLETDIAILNSSSTDFISNDYLTFPFLPYTVYPDEMAPLLSPRATIRNTGGLTQSEIRLNASLERVTDNLGVAGSASLADYVLDPGEETVIDVPSIQSPSELGGYNLVLYTTQSQADEDLSNNRTVIRYDITASNWAIESGPITASYYPPDPYVNVPYVAGNIFVPSAPGMTLESISTTIANGTSTPSSIFAAVYTFHPEDILNLTLVAQSSLVEVSPSMINTFGQENLTTLFFTSPVTLEEGETYFMAVGSPDGGDDVQFGLSSAAPAGASWLVFDNTGFFTLTKSPMVRCNLGTLASIEQQTTPKFAANVYPNPSIGLIQWTLPEQQEPYTLDVYDISGKKIMTKVVQAADQIDLSLLPRGYYSLMHQGENHCFYSKIILN